MALLALMDYEDERFRSKTTSLTSVKTFSRVYNLPPGGTSLIPARGDVLTLKTNDPEYDSDHTTDVEAPRVQQPPTVQQAASGSGAGIKLTVSAYKIIPYA